MMNSICFSADEVEALEKPILNDHFTNLQWLNYYFIPKPVDRNGVPVNVGDIIRWDDGDHLKVNCLVYLGEKYWIAEAEDGDMTDNISAGYVKDSLGQLKEDMRTVFYSNQFF